MGAYFPCKQLIEQFLMIQCKLMFSGNFNEKLSFSFIFFAVWAKHGHTLNICTLTYKIKILH